MPGERPAQKQGGRIVPRVEPQTHRRAPTGDEIATFDLENRKLSVTTAAGEAREFAFDYDSEGAHIMGIAAASNGTACGGTAFPMRFFSYDPGKDAWTRHPAYGQWNTLAATDSLFFVGAYAHGSLLEWDPGAAWVDTLKGNPESNPRFLHEAHPTIGRPHGLLAHPDGRHVILAGTPGYGFTGGGLMLWDRQAQTATILEHTALIEWHSTMALVPLPDGRLLGGTTISPGTGGAVKAALAELYILDLGTRKITWHAPLIEGAHAYVDMIMGPAGLVFGCANRTIFFVFDPARRTIVHREAIPEALGPTTSGQGPRIFVPSPDGRFFVLLTKGIAQLDPETYAFTLLAESPVSIAPGGAWLDGRIYFGHGSHLYSWEVPPPNAAE